MYAILNGFQATPVSPQDHALQILRATTPPNAQSYPHLLGFGPVARLNPYQSLIYKEFPKQGIAVSPVMEPIKFRDLLALAPLTSGLSLHLHWMNWLTDAAPDAAKARSLGYGYLGRLENFRRMGGRVIWTVHNVYPHDSRYIEEDLEIQQELANLADVIHLMSPAIQDAMSGITRIDGEKVVNSPHPSYAGAYEDYVTREAARAALAIDSDEVVFVMFGALKAYKGLGALLDAFNRLIREDRAQVKYRLVVAGHADDDPAVTSFVRDALTHPSILVEPTRVPANRTQYYLRAADVGLVTYERSLNSGAALLYQTFGLPVVATRTPVFEESIPSETAVFIEDIADTDAYAGALRKAVDIIGDATTNEVLKHIDSLHPSRVSQQFARQLASRLSLD